ncbi:hypothetical protein L2Y94_18095 [Luteibacter aegosomatis]|uniref:hypothetical protein n=1 Tax=Luteibacter aegosomatis TaxID=2911537 RepID=UPI001FF7FBCA|nr:hypothetical protein [Luteibacter aegosomatis]UPG85199.1 hypothetical protein L2Y94_18095 [Luteibacter aegosomatis]
MTTRTSKNPKILPLSTLASALLCCSQTGYSNQYKEISLSQKVENSDLVLIAKIASINTKSCVELSSCASVRVKSLLKGEPPKDFEVLFNGPIAEEDPLCCKIGSTYLMFLRKFEDRYYQSTNGPYGIYLIEIP